MTSRWAWGLFALAVFTIHAVSPMRVQSDSIWNVPVALSLLHRGDFTLDEYEAALSTTQHGVDHRDGHAYNTFPIGPSMIALPFLALADLVPISRWQTNSRAEAALKLGFFDTTEVLLGSMCVALSALLMGLLVQKRTEHRATAWLAAGVLAFASPAWSTASRALWQHGPAMLFLTAALWAWLGRAQGFRWAIALGFFLACAFVCRPTTAIPIVVISSAVALFERRRLPGLMLGAALVATPWLMLNQSMWQSWLPPYYLPGRLDAPPRLFIEALAGNLVSAGRGLLVFCPLVLLVFKGARRDLLTVVCLFVLLTHWVVISRFAHWWAGHAFGPRLFTELTPFWVLLLVPWFERLYLQRQWRSVGGLMTAVLLALTLFIHARGALSKRPWRWNTQPVDIDDQPSRVWDFRDLQFLR